MVEGKGIATQAVVDAEVVARKVAAMSLGRAQARGDAEAQGAQKSRWPRDGQTARCLLKRRQREVIHQRSRHGADAYHGRHAGWGHNRPR